MRIKRILLAALLALGLCCQSAGALSAQSWALADGDSGRILLSSCGDQQRLIASTTKLMTAYTAVHLGIDLDQTVTVSGTAAATEGSSMYLAAGEKLTLRDLLWGMLLVSGNDAANALAEGCCGDVETFVAQMNENAAALGMEHTHFENPTGLDGETHYSTAEDMVKLARAVLQEPVLAEIVSTKTATVAGRSLTNHNKLLSMYPGCTGMKTGYTEAAGRTLVSSAQRDGKTLICVTLNDPNDWDDHMALYDEAFADYHLETVCTAGEVLEEYNLTERFMQTEVCAEQTVRVLCGEDETITKEVTLEDRTGLLLGNGSRIGTVRYYIDGVQVGETGLLAKIS